MKIFNKKVALALAAALTLESSAVTAVSVFAATNTNQVKTALNSTKDLEVSKVYSGFKVISKQYINDIGSTVYELQHLKSGAKVIYVKNDDINKMISVNFKTIPTDNMGANHIIEHMVGDGANGGAGDDTTSSYCTQYYSSSAYDSEFDKIVLNYTKNVYDSQTIKNPNYFKLHGWRYEINSSKDPLTINGVVYNEMKAHHSSPLDTLGDVVTSSLFPDTPDRFDAGGNPDNIPDLNYNQILATYKKNYVPSNSLIYLYGNMNVQHILGIINDNCLSKFSYTKFTNTIPQEKPFDKIKDITDYYSTDPSKKGKSKTYVALNYSLGKEIGYYPSNELYSLNQKLMEKLQQNLTAANVQGTVSPYSQIDQTESVPELSIILEDANPAEKAKFKEVVEKTYKDIMKNGVSQALIDSVFNACNYYNKEDNISDRRALYYENTMMNEWVHDIDPIEGLEISKALSDLRQMLKPQNLNKLIQKYILDNKNASIVTLLPKVGLDNQKQAAAEKKLANYKSSLSQKQLNNLIDGYKAFQKWNDTRTKARQNEEPLLTVNDLNKKVQDIPTASEKINGINVIKHNLYTSDINFAKLYFDTTKVPQDKLFYISLLSNLLGKVDTTKYTSSQLPAIINNTGNIDFKNYVYLNYKNRTSYYPKMEVSLSSVGNTTKSSLELTQEIMNNSKFSNKTQLKNLINMTKENLYDQIQGDPSNYLDQQCESYTSDFGKYLNLTGIPYYEFLCDLSKNFDAKSDEIIKNLNEVKNEIFNRNNLLVSFTGNDSLYKNFAANFKALSNNIKNANYPVQKYKFDFSVKNEGFILPSKVQYFAKAGNFAKLGYAENGKLGVLERILDGYLAREIRVKRGAYGAGDLMSGYGDIFYSFRDPNLKETLNTFDNAGNYLKTFNPTKNQMTGDITDAIYISETIGSPELEGEEGDRMYISGETLADKQKYHDEVVSTTPQDIRNYAGMIDAIMKQNNFCVLGGADKINSIKNIFSSVKDLSE